MPEETTENRQEELPPPPDLEEFIDDVEGEYDFPEPGAGLPPVRRSSRKQRHRKPQQIDPAREAHLKELAQLELDEWSESFDWSQPNMQARLTRLAPPYFNGVKSSGFIETKKQAGYTLGEIKRRFGGGDYTMRVIGPRAPDDPRIKSLNYKTFSIPGDPIIDGAQLEESGLGPYSRPDPRRRQHQEEKKKDEAMDLVSSEVRMLREKVYSGDGGIEAVRPVYSEALSAIKEAAEVRAAAREGAAAEHVQIVQEQLKEERRRTEEMVKQMKEREEAQERMRQEAGNGSSAILTTLLPHIQDSAHAQVREMGQMYAAREERLQASHQMQMSQLQQMHQTQLSAQQMMYESQLKNVQSAADNNLSLLKHQVQLMQSEKEQLQRFLDEARQQVERARQDLMTHVVSAKPKDSVSQLNEMSTLMEAMSGFKEMMGGGAPHEVGDDLDNPIAKTGAKLFDKLLTNLPVLADAYIASKQGAPPQPQMQQVPQLQAAPVQQPQRRPGPPPQQGPQRRPAGAPQARPMTAPSPQPTPVLSREDVEGAVLFLNGVLANPSAPSVEDLARTMLSQVPRNVLRAFAQRPPEKVIEELDAAGFLKGKIATAEGREYVTGLILELKKHDLGGDQ